MLKYFSMRKTFLHELVFPKKQLQRRKTWGSPESHTKKEIVFILTNKKLSCKHVSLSLM